MNTKLITVFLATSLLVAFANAQTSPPEAPSEAHPEVASFQCGSTLVPYASLQKAFNESRNPGRLEVGGTWTRVCSENDPTPAAKAAPFEISVESFLFQPPIVRSSTSLEHEVVSYFDWRPRFIFSYSRPYEMGPFAIYACRMLNADMICIEKGASREAMLLQRKTN